MKTRRSRLNAQSPNKPKLLAEKGGRIFARVRYIAKMCWHLRMALKAVPVVGVLLTGTLRDHAFHLCTLIADNSKYM